MLATSVLWTTVGTIEPRSFISVLTCDVGWNSESWEAFLTDLPDVTVWSDRAEAPQRGQQLHLLCLHGQQAIRPHLLRGGLLHPSGPHGAGLPEDLRHGTCTRPADQHAAAGGWSRRQQTRHFRHGCRFNVGLCWPPTQPPHANGNQGGKDSVHHHGVLLPLLGAVLCHQRGGPVYRVHSAGKAVGGLPLAGLHQLHAEPHPLRLPKQVLPPCLPHHPVLWEEAVPQTVHPGAQRSLRSLADQRLHTRAQVSSPKHFSGARVVWNCTPLNTPHETIIKGNDIFISWRWVYYLCNAVPVL